MAIQLFREFESCTIIPDGKKEMDRFAPIKMIQSTLQGYTGMFLDHQDGVYRCIKAASKEMIESGMSVCGPTREDFFGERDLLKKLNQMTDCHGSICKYITEWESPTQSYYAMEFCSNGSLLDFANKRLHYGPFLSRPRRFKVVSRVMSQIVDALDWLHAKRIVHMDLSLENILMVNASLSLPKIKLIDFGVAIDFSDQSDRLRWADNRCVGKSKYMALEVRLNQARLVKERGHRIWYDAKAADIGTLGTILFMMLQGKYPPEYIREYAYDGHLREYTQENGLLVEFNRDSFDLLDRLWSPEVDRIKMTELIKHPFIVNGRKAYLKAKQMNEEKCREKCDMKEDDSVNHGDTHCGLEGERNDLTSHPIRNAQSLPLMCRRPITESEGM